MASSVSFNPISQPKQTCHDPASLTRALFDVIKKEKLKKVLDLIDKGVDVNAMYDNDLPLHLAARVGNIEIVKALLQNGANKNLLARGFTASRLATIYGKNSIAELIDNFEYEEY